MTNPPVSQKTIDKAHAKALKIKRYMETEYIPKDLSSTMGGLTPSQKKRLTNEENGFVL